MKYSLFDLKDILGKEIKKKKFLFYKVDKNTFEFLTEIIKKENGIISPILTKNVDFVITESIYDENITKVLKRNIQILQLEKVFLDKV